MRPDDWVRDCYLSLILAWVLLFGVVLVHEAAHWACARGLGFSAPRVVIGVGPSFFRMRWQESFWHFQLFPLMGYVYYRRGPRSTAVQRVSVALAGPAANLALAGVLYALVPDPGSLGGSCCGPLALVQLAADAYQQGIMASLHLFADFNLGVGVFNLLPLPTLDGGVLLEEPGRALQRAAPRFIDERWWSRAWSQCGAALIIAVNVLWLLSDFLF
jgi:membrane-associated protease RseP (regulator of RpoE activity)